jgi:outer membrane protein assembly factor BamB
VRAFALENGERKWIFDTKSSLFAPAAVADGVAYVADLAGTVRAITLSNGSEKWKLDVGSDPAVKAPGMIYGGPALHGGRLYVATCNIEGPNANKATAVICIGDK